MNKLRLFTYLLLVSCMSSSITYAASLENPLNFNTIQGFLQGVLGALMYLGLPLIALIIIYSGFLFVRAQGNSEQLQVAKKNFFYVIIGTGLFLGAWALTQIVAATISSLTSQV